MFSFVSGFDLRSNTQHRIDNYLSIFTQLTICTFLFDFSSKIFFYNNVVYTNKSNNDSLVLWIWFFLFLSSKKKTKKNSVLTLSWSEYRKAGIKEIKIWTFWARKNMNANSSCMITDVFPDWVHISTLQCDICHLILDVSLVAHFISSCHNECYVTTYIGDVKYSFLKFSLGQ